MRIESIAIENFRAIAKLSISNLKDMIVIAGPNGSGKSCVLDAIRLVKSMYGGYQHNEVQQFFGEFQYAAGRNASILPMLKDREKPLRIRIEFSLHKHELNYIAMAARELAEQVVLRRQFPEAYNWDSSRYTRMALQGRVDFNALDQEVDSFVVSMNRELAQPKLIAEVKFEPNGYLVQTPSVTLTAIFASYKPQQLGVIDFHGAQRQYAREQVGGINLNLENAEQQMRNHALYNYANKYSNVKSELAAQYVRDVIAQKSGAAATQKVSLEATLKELFRLFFPGKEFLGPDPKPDGTLDFPVKIDGGGVHDLNELSSGEKEVLYGYLRLRNSAPKYSIVLLDEPELHLNPRLIRGLPQFYHDHIGKALCNQMWLITHSDALLREAVGHPGFSVFHMFPPGSDEASQNQLRAINAGDDLERAVIDLVGDLASYRPGSPIVILEGGGDSEFDVRVVTALFPQIASAVTLVAGGNKARVRQLHEVLESIAKKGGLATKLYSIVDQDNDRSEGESARCFKWDVFHIENYLLDKEFLHKVLLDLDLAKGKVSTPDGIAAQLKVCASELVSKLAHERLESETNSSLVSTIRTKTNPDSKSRSQDLFNAIARSRTELDSKISTTLSLETLVAREACIRSELENDLQSDAFLKSFRGRDLLRSFVGKFGNGNKYETIRDLVLARMADSQHQPQGMLAVLERIT